MFNMSELTDKDSCVLRRSRDIHIEKSGDSNAAKRSALAKSVIRQVYQRTITGQQASRIIDDYFEGDSDYAVDKTKKIFAEEMKACLNRYFTSEKRHPLIPNPMTVSVAGCMDVYVKPDLVFIGNDYIEVVIFKYSRPRIFNNGKKKETNSQSSLELYSLLCYGRLVGAQLSAQNRIPQNTLVRASYYYLRKANDSDRNGVFDKDFFDDAGRNVAYLDDPQALMGGKNAVDIHFIPIVKDFLKGTTSKCTEEKCKGCEFYGICSYKQAPTAIDRTQKEVKIIKNLMLTSDQASAVSFKQGIARINAGAGAGKTLTIALRTVELLKAGVRPEEIILLTFTNTGAEEMRQRIDVFNKEFGNGCDISNMHIQTFNAFQNEIIHREWPYLGFDKEPKLIDDVERSSIIVDILKKQDIPGVDFRNFYMNTKDVQGALIVTRKIFDIMKKEGLGTEQEDIERIIKCLGMAGRFIPPASIGKIASLYDEYTQRLNEDSLIEFADQELLVFQIIYTQPDYFNSLGIKHIIVDEFQDSDQGQMDFIKVLSGTPSFESLMVVGDDSQAIFGFRGTSPKFIIDFWNILGCQGTDFYLLENHRSTPEIIDFANRLNALNTCRVIKDLKAVRPHGRKPVARGFHNKEQEYGYIVENIKEKLKEGRKPEEIAFIASTKSELLKMASLLTEAGIPSVLLNPEPLMDNSKVLAAVDMVRFIDNPKNTEAEMNWLNCLTKNNLLQYNDAQINKIMKKALVQVEEMKRLPEKQKLQSLHAMLDALDENDEVYESFVDTLKSKPCVSKVMEYCENFLLFGSTCAVRRKNDYPGVTLTTAHSSKGLEWPVVFNSITKYDAPEIRRKVTTLEEKRRLFFVSATRARDELYITAEYTAFGTGNEATYNMFLTEAYDILGQVFAPEADIQD